MTRYQSTIVGLPILEPEPPETGDLRDLLALPFEDDRIPPRRRRTTVRVHRTGRLLIPAMCAFLGFGVAALVGSVLFF